MEPKKPNKAAMATPDRGLVELGISWFNPSSRGGSAAIGGVAPCLRRYAKKMSLPLQLYRVKSRKGRKEYFVGIPAGDTDMATAGVMVLTSNRSPEVIVARLTADEYADYESGPALCARRISAELGRDDLQPVELDLGTKGVFPESIHFVQNFGLSHPFHDIHNPKDLADVVCAVSIEEFESQGGIVRDLRKTTNA